MKHILIAIVAMFTIMGTQAAEPRTNKKSVKKILKEIKSLAGNHIRVEEYNGDSIVNDVKNQLNAQFEDKKAAQVFEKYKIKLDNVIYAESQDEEGYNQLRKFAARLKIDANDKLAGVPLQLSSSSDTVKTALFTDENNQFIFTDSLLSKNYSILYFDDDFTGKTQSMLQQLVNDRLKESMPTLGSGAAIIEAGDDEEEDDDTPTGFDRIINDCNRMCDSTTFKFTWVPDFAAIYWAFIGTDKASCILNANFDKDKYTFEGERPSIHYYEGNSNSGYNKMSGNAWFYQLSRNKAGTKIYDGTRESVWAADTLGMRVRQYHGMKNVTIYMIDIPEERQCAALIVNAGLKTFKDFFNSYTLNGEERVADKYNVIFTIGGDKVQSTKEEVNGKKSGLHLKFAPLEKARAKGLLPLYEYSM